MTSARWAAVIVTLALTAPAQAQNHGHTIKARDGYQMTVHGPDPPAVATTDNTQPTAPAGAEHCATDNYQHFLYAYQRGQANNTAAVRTKIQDWATRMDAKLNEASLESGGPTAVYKYLCTADGTIRLNTIVVDGDTAADVVIAARDAGYTAANAHYSIVWDGHLDGYCGIAGLGGFNKAPMYAITRTGCGWTTAMHENAHNQGAVSADAPNTTGHGHCTDEQDVMCYPDYPNYPEMRQVCPSPERFDCGHDDYFDTAPETGEWLSQQGVWNMGSTANKFIRLGGAPPPPPPPPPPPCKLLILGHCYLR